MKKIALLAPLAGWTTEQFKTYWRETHGPVVSRSPGYDAYRQRYVQNHVVGPGPVGGPFRYGGVAEFWTPGGLEIEQAIAQSDIYRNRIGPDEARFLDLEGTIAVAAEETVVVPGDGEVKVMVFAARAAGMTSSGYAERRRALAAAIAGRPDRVQQVRGYRQNHVLEGSLRSIAAPALSEITFDSLDEYWFDSMADMNAFFAAAAGDAMAAAHDALVRPGSLVSFVAEEIVFFADGRPVDPPRRPQLSIPAKSR